MKRVSVWPRFKDSSLSQRWSEELEVPQVRFHDIQAPTLSPVHPYPNSACEQLGWVPFPLQLARASPQLPSHPVRPDRHGLPSLLASPTPYSPNYTWFLTHMVNGVWQTAIIFGWELNWRLQDIG